MKYVTTVEPHRRLVVESDDDGNPTRTVSNVPLEVSNSDAEKYTKLGDETGVLVAVSDSPNQDPDTGSDPVAQPTPDLSAGVGAVTGGGAPVENTEAGVVVPDVPATRTRKTTSKDN